MAAALSACSGRAAGNAVTTTVTTTELQQQLDDAEQSARCWRIAFFVALGLYAFVYVMGRRRLMRKIWKRNRQLRSALEQADEANRMKTSFIRSMSHEIRTPLNAINGFSQLLCSQDFDMSEQERLDMKDRIAGNVETITLIINELLELAQSDSQQPARNDNVKPNELCRAVLEASKLKDTKGLDLRFESTLKDSFSLKSNSEMVSQILEKLLDNALKFTEKGSITIAATRKGDMVAISVADTGIGIPESKRKAVFENFVKLDDYRDGIGLGLPICRRLARSLGGNIVIDPKYKNGSCFVLQLPC